MLPSRAAAIDLQSIGTFSAPVQVASPPGDPRLFVVERTGTIQVIDGGVRTQFLDIQSLITTNSSRGLLSMAFDPSYSSNGLFYVFYTGDGTNSGGALNDIHIDEFHVSNDPDVANVASRRTVWTFPHGSSIHNGGQLAFGPDGLLYISVGDDDAGGGVSGLSNNAQSLANPYGKILRIDPHGAGDGDHGVPPTNPFPTSGTPEIWSLGLRNPFRFSFDRLTGDLVMGDVGEDSREEIDFAPAATNLGRGANYGWPCREGFIAGPGGCDGTFTDPVLDYPHASPDGILPSACAAIAGFVYRGSQIPELSGRFLYADLCTKQLRSALLELPLASGDRAEGVLPNSPNGFGEDANCELYVTSGNTVQKILGSQSGTVAPACQTPPLAAAAAPTQTETKCVSRKEHRAHNLAAKKRRGGAGAAKKRRKLCVSGSWASGF